MAKFYKELDIEFEELRREIETYIFTNHGLDLRKSTYSFGDIPKFKEAVPSLRAFFDKVREYEDLNYYDNLSYIGLCILQPRKVLQPHIDCSPSMVGVNIPILGCEGTSTQFYRGWAKAHMSITETVSGISVTKAKVLEEFELKKPTFFLPKVPHGVLNHKDTLRVMVSLRFTEDPLTMFFKEE